MVFDQDKALFKTFANHSEATYEDPQPTFMLELIDVHCDNVATSSSILGLFIFLS
jgi:hypothetical protein